jgi:hypothetical protein
MDMVSTWLKPLKVLCWICSDPLFTGFLEKRSRFQKKKKREREINQGGNCLWIDIFINTSKKTILYITTKYEVWTPLKETDGDTSGTTALLSLTPIHCCLCPWSTGMPMIDFPYPLIQWESWTPSLFPAVQSTFAWKAWRLPSCCKVPRTSVQ